MLDNVLQLAPVLAVPAAGILLWVLWRRVSSGRVSAGVAVALSIGLLAGVAGTLILPLATLLGMSSVDPLGGWALTALGAGSLTTLALLTRAAIGDPSRGRRRCPRCWYDMAGVPSLTCPECGRDARHERRLFLSRRRWTAIGASLLPFIISASLFGAWFFNQSGWIRSTPTLALVAASPWVDGNHHMGWELRSRLQPDTFQAGLQAFISRRMTRHARNSYAALFHASILVQLDRHNSKTVAALVALTRSDDPSVVERAAETLGKARVDPHVIEPALLRLLDYPYREVRDAALGSLIAVKRERRGGPPPPELIAEVLNPRRRSHGAYTALRLFDPSDEVRAAMIAVANRDWWDNELAAGTLATLFPDDPATAKLVTSCLKNPKVGVEEFRVITAMAAADERAIRETGSLPRARRALYTSDVRRALVRAAGMGPFSPEVESWLRSHPVFSSDEQTAVNAALDAPRPPPLSRGRY